MEGMADPWYVHYDRRRWLAYQETPSMIGREIDLDASLIDGRLRHLIPVAKGPWG